MLYSAFELHTTKTKETVKCAVEAGTKQIRSRFPQSTAPAPSFSSNSFPSIHHTLTTSLHATVKTS